jgi:multisubunit Na+/H+ antiporter MnhF subunit
MNQNAMMMLTSLAAAPPLPDMAAFESHRVLMSVTDVGIAAIGLCMLLCVYRLLRGPHLADRGLAVDTLGVMLIGMVGLLSIRQETIFYIDGILVLSLLSFAGTVATAQFIARKRQQRNRANAAHKEAAT